MSFGWLGGLMSLMPGYLQGRQQAVNENWKDLENFNNVQAGQLRNAYEEATFEPRVGMQDLLYENGKLGLYDNSMKTALGIENYPSYVTQARMFGQYAPELAQAQAMQQMYAPFINLMAVSRLMNMPGMTPTALLGGK